MPGSSVVCRPDQVQPQHGQPDPDPSSLSLVDDTTEHDYIVSHEYDDDDTTTTDLYPDGDTYTYSDNDTYADADETTFIASNQLTPEQHVAQGIAFHESGNDASLSRSTYHLRRAALAGHPTGMLLYALACRHGWGVRPNATEGVKWLKKAVDLGGQEFTDGDDDDGGGGGRGGKKQDILATVTALDPSTPSSPSPSTSTTTTVPYPAAPTQHAAHLALAVYELGVSHMNGWGTAVDRGLALRCFDIAAAWGDLDALMEAAFCYAEGIGCKGRDRGKAARMYRAAERRGRSIVGNSWIYKEKYMDDDDGKGKKKEKGMGMGRIFSGFSSKKKKKEKEKS